MPSRTPAGGVLSRRTRRFVVVTLAVWVVMALVVPITVFLAWAITRTNMPLRRLLEGILISHIFSSHKHFDADELVSELQSSGRRVSRATV